MSDEVQEMMLALARDEGAESATDETIRAVRRAVELSKPVCMDDKTFSEMTQAELARVHQWQRMVHALMAGLGVSITEGEV